MNKSSSIAAARQYQQIDINSEIESASPHRLIQLMMERVVTKIAVARRQMLQNAISEKGASISDAISVINGLQASLNHKPAASLSGKFDALYDYMNRRLLEANLRDDPTILDEVSGLMRELKEAWDAIADEAAIVDQGTLQN